MEPKALSEGGADNTANMLTAEYVRAAYVSKMRELAKKAIVEINNQLSNQRYLDDSQWRNLVSQSGDAYTLKVRFNIANILNDLRDEGEEYIYIHELMLVFIAEYYDALGYETHYDGREDTVTLICGEITKDLK